TLDLAESRLQSTIEAEAKGAAQKWEVKQRENERDIGKAALQVENDKHAQTVAAVELEKARLDRYQVKAPFDGIIIRIPAKAGATLSHTDQILTMAKLDELEATINLPVE